MNRINDDIRTGQLKQMYLLYGEEAYLRKQYRDRLREAIVGSDTMNYRCYEGKNIPVGEVIDLAETLPFFADRRLIVIQSSGLFKSGGEELAEYLGNPAAGTFFVFVETEVDKRSRLYKAVNKGGYAAEFTLQDEAVLKKWILGMVKREKKKISGQALEYFLDKTGTDMENIRREAEKLFCYCMDKESIEIEDIEEICTKRISSHIFDMINAIADKKQQRALELYYELLALREPPMRILFLITRQFNLLMQVKELQRKGYSNKLIGEKVGLSGFIAGKYVTQAARFDSGELRRAVEACVEAETDIKTGKLNDNMSLELLIIRYSS